LKILHTSDTHYGFDHNTAEILGRFFEHISKLDIDIITIAGDLISNKTSQLRKFCKLIRDRIDKPILVVHGNHDFWNTDKDDRYKSPQHRDIESRILYSIETLKEFNMNYLRTPYQKDNVRFYGFDGWYSNTNPPSNDEMWMPKSPSGLPIHQYMSNRAFNHLYEILDDVENYNNTINICVTHFQPYLEIEGTWESMSANPRYLEVLKDKFKYLLTGHTHKELECNYHGMKIINSGSNYNKPKYRIIEV